MTDPIDGVEQITGEDQYAVSFTQILGSTSDYDDDTISIDDFESIPDSDDFIHTIEDASEMILPSDISEVTSDNFHNFNHFSNQILEHVIHKDASLKFQDSYSFLPIANSLVHAILNPFVNTSFDRWLNFQMDYFFNSFVKMTLSSNQQVQSIVNQIDFNASLAFFDNQSQQQSLHLKSAVSKYFDCSLENLKVLSINIDSFPFYNGLRGVPSNFFTDARYPYCLKNFDQPSSDDSTQSPYNLFASFILLCSVYYRFYIVNLTSDSLVFVYNPEDLNTLYQEDSGSHWFSYQDHQDQIATFFDFNTRIFDSLKISLEFNSAYAINRMRTLYYNYLFDQVLARYLHLKIDSEVISNFDETISNLHIQVKTLENNSSSNYGWS